MRTHRGHFARASALFALCLSWWPSLAACGGGGGGQDGQPPGGGAVSDAASFCPYQPCALVTTDDLSQALGGVMFQAGMQDDTLSSTTPAGMLDEESLSCTYIAPAGFVVTFGVTCSALSLVLPSFVDAGSATVNGAPAVTRESGSDFQLVVNVTQRVQLDVVVGTFAGAVAPDLPAAATQIATDAVMRL